MGWVALANVLVTVGDPYDGRARGGGEHGNVVCVV